MGNQKIPLLAIFDHADYLDHAKFPMHIPSSFHQDYQQATRFLLSYKHNAETFKSFRREIERFLQWSFFIAKKTIFNLKREDIESYLMFCQKPPIDWIGTKKVSRFIEHNGKREPNPEWRLFIVTLPKSKARNGIDSNVKQYSLSEKGFREIFTILNCFYNFLIQEDITPINPILQIRQKNRFYRTIQGGAKIRRISELQWKYVLSSAEEMAAQNPEKHERTLFVISILYSLYLRISELVAQNRWSPKMNDFAKDYEGNWWFTTVGKGNKERQISVSDSMLEALKRWRKYLNLTPLLPTPNDSSPLIPKIRGLGPVTDTSHVRRIVQTCFDHAIVKLRENGFVEEADALGEATVHWLRHTGISDDVKIRPREHVRDDAGHSSSSITDKYIDVELRARHASAKKKLIKTEKFNEVD